MNVVRGVVSTSSGKIISQCRQQRRQHVVTPRICWGPVSSPHVVSASRALLTTYATTVGGGVVSAASSERLAGRTSPRTTHENEAA